MNNFVHFDRWLVLLGYRSPDWSSVWKKWLFYLAYSGSFLILVTMPFIFTLIDLVNTREKIVISSACFHLIIPIQYIIGLIYFKNTHLKSTLQDCKNQERHLLPDLLLIVIIIILAGLATGCLALFMKDGEIPQGFDFLIDWSEHKSAMIIFMYFLWTLSWIVLITNIVIFTLVFIKHLRDIKELKRYIETVMIWKLDQNNFSELTQKIVAIRFVISRSVDAMENFYTFTTILGAIAIGPILEFRQLNRFLIFYVLIYIVLQIVFVAIIYSISKCRSDILKIIKSPAIMFKYLNKIKKTNNVEAFRNDCDYSNDPDKVQIFNQSKIVAYSPTVFEEVEEDEINKLEKGMDEIQMEILTVGYKSNAAIDWMILHAVLSEKWTDFNLMGVSFSDSNVVKKSIGVTSLIILASTYINSLHLL